MLMLQLTRAYVIWALLIGQGVLIASFVSGIGWRHIDSPWGAEIILATLALSGLVGLVGEWIWRNKIRPE